MGKNFNNKKEGQIEFFNTYKQYIPSIKNKELNDILQQYSDGIIGGNILEFKLIINDINKVLFQTIKYLSKMRISGISIPKNILLISLNANETYLFNSNDFLEYIEKIYIGASSKDNDNFYTQIEPEKILFNTESGKAKLIKILREDKYTKIHIDENCILGWAKRFYKEIPKATKGSFLGSNEDLFKNTGEIRFPSIFKDFIYPYEDNSNEKFKYLMDVLNDKIRKKETGAFYTPIPYCKKAIELVREAIKLVPKGNDYIILDRCAGTGNLEIELNEEELSHCVLSTYEYYEYKVLVERLGDKVRYIIPPFENEIHFKDGFISNADALSEEYIKNEYLQQIINNPKITIILFENPPYRDTTSNTNTSKASKGFTNFVKREMQKDFSGIILNDLSNLFIWSGFKYFLRQPTDSYILFSPVKYFKSCNLVNKYFKNGFLFNRKHFHATPSAISCIWWQNIDKEQEEFNLQIFDIEENIGVKDKQEAINHGKIKDIKNILIKKVHKKFSEVFFDKRKNENYIATINLSGYNLDSNSVGLVRKREDIKGHGSCFYLFCEDEEIAYLRATSFNLDGNSATLTRLPEGAETYSPHGKMINKNNFISKLPLFCAKLYPQENWYEKDVYFTTADSREKYLEDKDLLKSCLFYTCLTNKNHCKSFFDSDKCLKNELCFDGDTIAKKYLQQYQLNDFEKEIFNLWSNILNKIKQTTEYSNNLNYGLYQIEQEINIFIKNENDKKIYKYPKLNSDVKILKQKLKEYYKNYIQEKLFKYELLK